MHLSHLVTTFNLAYYGHALPGHLNSVSVNIKEIITPIPFALNYLKEGSCLDISSLYTKLVVVNSMPGILYTHLLIPRALSFVNVFSRVIRRLH